MRRETWVSLTACSLGIAGPLAYASRCLPERIDEIPAVVAGSLVAALPFVLVAGTAWVARSDRRASRIVAVVAVLVLLIGYGGWFWAAQDPKGIALFLTGILFVPAAQLVVWLAGAVVSGRTVGSTDG